MTDVQTSLYEHLFALTTVMKQRVVENFDGDALDERWTTRNVAGAGTFAMSDNADEGFSITSGETTNNESRIDFNNIRQYDPVSSIALLILEALSNTSAVQYGGFAGNTTTFDGVEKALFCMDSANANSSLRTADASTSSETSSGVALNTNHNAVKVECGSSNIKLYLAGSLLVTKTTNRPTAKHQPCIGVKTTTGSGKALRTRYCEAYNV